ncbi:MAG: hypothetical protein MASP_00765 [Candidatus Methanolliviera sp. GoM_asphalt]|nr:MAG: hypothetical protein MASP_00765 [Candidatus Methanolliviera sp. GoM_asphalt]
MINSANQYQISDIFSIDTKVKYVIPKFQREYIWGKQQWEDLLNDLVDNDKGYFLGSIICINKGKDALDITPLEIIDGQQRLTAISLLYAATYDRLLKEERNDDDFITEKNNLKHRLIQKGRKNELKLELSHQNNNFEDYKAILNNLCLYTETNFKKPPNLGNRRIYKMYRYFKNKISEFDYDKLLGILDKINSSLVVKIEVDDHADAFMLFESLNNRGIPLSAMDLIKNKILSELEKKKVKSIEEASNKWIELIRDLPDYSVQERFLRQYYNAFRYKGNIKVRGIYKATRSTLIRIYDKLIEKNADFIFDELIKKSKIYNLFIEPKNEGDNANYYKGLLDLLYIGAAPSYTLLLYLFSEYKTDTKLIKDTTDFLVKYFVRRNLTDFPGTRDLDYMFMNLIDECEKNKNKLTSAFLTDYLTQSDKFADIKIFKEKLEDDIYEDNVAVARFILCKIEEEHQTREIYTDLWEKDNNRKYLWTIEHIYPEGKNIPKEWVNIIAGGNEEEAKELQTKWVHKLGNLTLTAYNSNLSNFSFEKKRDRQNSKGDQVGYRNGLYLNKKLADKNS